MPIPSKRSASTSPDRSASRSVLLHQFLRTERGARPRREDVALPATAAARKQRGRRGCGGGPGESVRCVLRDAGARDSGRKVGVAEFVNGKRKRLKSSEIT